MHSEPGVLGPYVPWGQLAGKLSHRDLGGSELFKRSDRVECCPLAPGKEQIEWGKPEACSFVDIMAVNYSAPYVEGLY
jgi:hypothetical protein